MRRVAGAALFLFVCPLALAQMHGHAAPDPAATSPCTRELAAATDQREFQRVDWPLIMQTMKDSPALPFFKQGMTQYWGYNYEEAMRNFKMAKELDQNLEMASWGIALAAGPNINLDMDGPCHLLAKKEIARAADCMAHADVQKRCEPRTIEDPLAKELIKQLIAALRKRYAYPEENGSRDAKEAAENYRLAMENIWKNHGKDKNVAALYAESMIDLQPWDLYDKEGNPQRYADEIVAVLEASIGDSLEAIGANHYYIHAIERPPASQSLSDPEATRALMQRAERTADLLQTQVPKSGHLVHMSSHVYLLLGNYQKSLDVNITGANNDVTQYGRACSGPYRIYNADKHCPQLY